MRERVLRVLSRTFDRPMFPASWSRWAFLALEDELAKKEAGREA